MLASDFVTGAVIFLDEWDGNSRIVIPVTFGSKKIMAIVDTGAPYCVLAPDIADEVGIDPLAGERLARPMGTRLGSYGGWLCRVPIMIVSEFGQSAEFETTVFIPDDSDGLWPPNKNFIGLTNFLTYIRFAVDPSENLFYFSGAP